MEDNKPKKVSDWGEEVTNVAPKKVSDWGEEVTDEPVKKKEESVSGVPSEYPMGRGPLALPTQEAPSWKEQIAVGAKEVEPSGPAKPVAKFDIKLPSYPKTRAEAEAIKPTPVYPTGDKASERVGLLESRKEWLSKKMNLGATIIKGLESEFEKSTKRVQEKQAYVNSLQNELNRRSDISDATKKQVYDAAVADYQTAFSEYETTRKNLERQYKRYEIADKKMLEASEEQSKIAKQQTGIGSAYDALNTGLNNLWAMTLRAPQYAYNQMINAQNNLFRAVGAEGLVAPLQKDGLLSDAAKHFEANAEAYNLVRSKKYAEYENSISKALEKKDYDAAIDLAAQGIIESAPITAGISLATMAGVTPVGVVLGGGVVFGGEKYKQLEEEYGDKIDENTKMANSFSTGLIEGIFEELGTAKIIESLVGRGLGKKALEEQARTTFQRIYKNALLKVTPVATATMEGLSEAETTFAENVIDIASGIKAPDQVLDGVEDAFYVGAGTGAIMGFLLKPKNDPVDPELRRKANDAKNRLDRLNATLSDPNVPDAIKQAINDQASAIATEIIEANEQDDEMTKGFSQDAIKRLEAIGSEVDELEKGLESVTDEVSKEAVNKKIEELNKERDFIYNLQYTKETLRKQRDLEIQELEKIRPDLTDQDLLLTDLPASVDKTLDRVYEGTPTDPVQIQEAIDALDKKFDELEAYKKDPKRTHTTEVIDSLIDVLSEAKSTLQRYENEVRPTEARAEEGAGKPEVPSAKGITPEQKATGGEVTAPSVPAIEAAEDISKEDENYRQSREVTEAVSKENPDASVLITPRGNDLNLAAVYVGKEKRGKGIGSKVLDSVKRQADRLGKKVVLDATNELDEETDLEKLGKFYERNGFVKVGENKYEYNPPKGGGIAAPSVPAIETKPTQYDKENIQGVSGEERVGQEPEQAKPEQKGGAEAPSAGGILQATEEEIEATAKALEGADATKLGYVKYEDAIIVEPQVDFDNLPKGNDELSREARSQAIRDQENKPPKYKKYPIGTRAVDRFGEVYELREVPLDEAISKKEGTQREATIDKYAEWIKQGNEMPPAKGVENFATERGKVKITDGNHRYQAAKKAGLKTIPVWVALTDKKNTARPIYAKNEISEAYHKAKADGSNPELVAAVEQLIKPTTDETKTETKDGEPMSKGVSGVRPEGEGREKGPELRPEAEEEVTKEFVTNAGRKGEKPKTGVGSGEVNPTFSEKKVLVGDKTSIRFADGTKEDAEFMIVELDDIMASHDEESFSDTKGFPTMPDGRNVNSRNYKGDRAAQGTVTSNAMNLDPDILITDNVTTDQGAPIITEDGIVISANGRTMSLKLAEKKYPEKYKEYRETLIAKAKRYGIDPKAVAQMKKPVLVKINRNVKEYSVDSFDRYNPEFQKAEAPIDRLLKQSYIIRNNPIVRQRLMELLSPYDTMAELYASEEGKKGLLNFLVANKFILPQSMAEYADEKSNFTEAGKRLAEDIIVGAILRPETIKASQDVKAFRNNVINSIAALATNYTLGNFSLEDEINEAILLQQKVAAWGPQKDFWKYLKQKKLFDAINPDHIIMNRLIESGSKNFRQFIEKYNTGAEGQGAQVLTLTFDDVKASSKQEVLDYMTKLKLSQNELEILALVYDRYAEFAEQNKRGIEELGRRLGEEEAPPAEPKEPTEPQKPAGAEVKPSAPAQAPTSVPADLASAISQTSELYSRIYDPETTAKEKRELKSQIKEMLKDYPYLEYIYNNIKGINSQLETAGLLTKEGNCP